MAADPYAWDPYNKSALITLSNDNRTAEKVGGNAWCNVKGLREMDSGKWYWEIYYDRIQNVSGVTQGEGIALVGFSTASRVGIGTNNIEFEEWVPCYYWNSTYPSWGLGMVTSDTLMVAYDGDAGKIWFGKNGTWMVSGNPAGGTNECKSGFTGAQLPTFGSYGALNKATIRTTAALCSYTAPTNFNYLAGVEYYFSGYVYEQGSSVARTLYLHNRDDGDLMDTTTSSGNGYYYLETTFSGSHYIVCLDDSAGEDYNDLIIGDVYPTTVSG